MKEFDQWNIRKKRIDECDIKDVYFKDREICWCSVVCNIGYEEDGKGEKFARPILIVKKCNQYVFIGIPLSTTKKRGAYYIPFSFRQGISVGLISQIKLFDRRRLIDKMGMISQDDFNIIKNAAKNMF